jgi:hypothetical protein
LIPKENVEVMRPWPQELQWGQAYNLGRDDQWNPGLTFPLHRQGALGPEDHIAVFVHTLYPHVERLTQFRIVNLDLENEKCLRMHGWQLDSIDL